MTTLSIPSALIQAGRHRVSDATDGRLQTIGPSAISRLSIFGAASHEAKSEERGRSSGVEHNLAKVGVVSSNLIARSNINRTHRNSAPSFGTAPCRLGGEGLAGTPRPAGPRAP